jgi:hypothetical protein
MPTYWWDKILNLFFLAFCMLASFMNSSFHLHQHGKSLSHLSQFNSLLLDSEKKQPADLTQSKSMPFSIVPVTYNSIDSHSVISHTPKQLQQYQESLPTSHLHIQETVLYCCAPWILCKYQRHFRYRTLFVCVTMSISKQTHGHETTDICHWKHFHITCRYGTTHHMLCFHCFQAPTISRCKITV